MNNSSQKKAANAIDSPCKDTRRNQLLKETAVKYLNHAQKLGSCFEQAEAYKHIGNAIVNEAEDCLENSQNFKDQILKRRAWEIQFEVKIKSAIKNLEEASFQLMNWKRELPLEALNWQEYQ